MSVLENFKSIPRSPPHRATGHLHGPIAHPEGQGPVCNKNIYNQTSGDLFVIKIFTHRLGGRSPVPRATGEAGRPPSGDRPPALLFPGLHVWSGRWLVAPVRFK